MHSGRFKKTEVEQVIGNAEDEDVLKKASIEEATVLYCCFKMTTM